MNPQTFALDLYWYNPPRKNPASLEGASVGQQDMVPPPSSSSLTKRWPPHHWIQKTLGWKKSKLFKVLEKLWSMHNPCFHKYYCLEVGYSMYLSFIKRCWLKEELCCAQTCPTLCNPMDHSLPFLPLCPWDSPEHGLPFASPGDLPNPGMEPMSPALAGGFFATEPPRKPPKRTTV